jgi:hypothetical protein
LSATIDQRILTGFLCATPHRIDVRLAGITDRKRIERTAQLIKGRTFHVLASPIKDDELQCSGRTFMQIGRRSESFRLAVIRRRTGHRTLATCVFCFDGQCLTMTREGVNRIE